MRPTNPGGAGPTSVRSARVSAVRALQQRTVRQERREFLVEGPQAVAEAIGVPGLVHDLYLTEAALAAHPRLSGHPRPAVVPDAVLAAMAETRSPQGVVAVCGFLDVTLGEALDGAAAPAMVAVLWQIRDPGNAGTVLRTADAAGAAAVLLSEESVDVYNGKCVRSSAGSLFHVPVVRDADVLAAVEDLRARGFAVLAADGSGTADLYDLLPGPGSSGVLAGPVAWVFGNEARGLAPAIADTVDLTVSIPHAGRAESLNLAAAASVCLMTTAACQAGRVVRPR